MPAVEASRALRQEIERLFPSVYHKYHARRRQPLEGCNVTAPMLSLLRLLARHADQPLSVSTVAQQACLALSTISEMLSRLEARGLVLRQRDEMDERRVYVVLTVTGRTVIRRLDGAIERGILAEALAHLSLREQRFLLEALRKLARVQIERKERTA